MPSTLHQVVTTAWREGSRLWQVAGSPSWREGTRIWASPSAYSMPDVPPGGVVVTPQPIIINSLQIDPAGVYQVVHAMSALDTRDNSPLEILSATISTDEDSSVWTLRATVPAAAFVSLTGGTQPATISVNLSGVVWAFAIDSVARSRSFGAYDVSITGRSLTSAAGAPFQAEQNWVSDGDINAAQVAALANLYTGVEVIWEIEDWVIPDKVLTFSGTPFALVRRLAEAVGAVVRSDRMEALVYVSPRYPKLPHEWNSQTPDAIVAWEVVETEAFERADRPAYTGLYLAGQQGGAFGFARLAGTSGAVQHPLVTDLLLTEEPALRQRAVAVLGASGEQARVTMSMPVLTGPGQPGVFELGQLVLVADPDGPWRGMVRAVNVTATHGQMRQQVVLERHTGVIEGTEFVGQTLVFLGSIPLQAQTVGEPYSFFLPRFWGGAQGDITWSVASGTLPPGITLDPDTGELSGTPEEGSQVDTVTVRATDETEATADGSVTLDAAASDAPPPIVEGNTITYRIIGNPTAYPGTVQQPDSSGNEYTWRADFAPTGTTWPSVTAPTPPSGFVFLRWSDGVLTAARPSAPATTETTVRAEYMPVSGGLSCVIDGNLAAARTQRAHPEAHLYDATVGLTWGVTFSGLPNNGTNVSPVASYGTTANVWTGVSLDMLAWDSAVIDYLTSGADIDEAEPPGPLYFPSAPNFPTSTITFTYRLGSAPHVYTATYTRQSFPFTVDGTGTQIPNTTGVVVSGTIGYTLTSRSAAFA